MKPRQWRISWAGRMAIRAVSVLMVLAVLSAGLARGEHSQILAMGIATGDSVVVDTDYLNLRSGAGLSYAVLDVLESDTALTVTGGPKPADDYTWYEVRTGGGTTGWVAVEYLAFVQSWARFAVGDLAVVDTPRLNCRSAPGLDSGVIYVMGAGTEVDILDGPASVDGYHWYKVESADGEVGWVAGEFLVPGVDAPGSDFGKGDDVVVATDVLNLRRGAGLDKSVIDALPRGTLLLVSNGPSAADGYDWYEVETRDGRLGWVAGKWLAAASGRGFTAGDAVRVTGGRLNLRAEPGLSARVLRVVAGNEVLLVRGGPVEADGYSWYRVWNYGGEGWAAGEFLRFEPNGFPPEGGG